jgi:hypothetical protein
VTN